MTIALLQQSGITATNATFTQTFNINGTIPGSGIIVPYYHANNSFNGTGGITCSDNVNGSYTQDGNVSRVSGYDIGFWRFLGGAGGNITITLTATKGTAGNSFWRTNVLEYSGLSGVVDTTAFNTAQSASSTGPIAVTSNSLNQQASELCLAIGSSDQGVSGTANASGWVARGLLTNLSINELIAPGTSTVSASMGTLSSASGWDASVVAYIATIPPPPIPVTPSKLIFIMP